MKEIKTIEEYLKIIFELYSEIDYFNDKFSNWLIKDELIFRGQANQNYTLVPAIGRSRKDFTDFSILDKERELIEMAKYKLPHIFNDTLNTIDLLSLLQHYGIPTRLLDVTLNPLVALYFSVLNNNEDGEVIVFQKNNIAEPNYLLNIAIADSYKSIGDRICPLERLYNNGEAYSGELIKKLNQEIDEIEKYIYEYCNDIILVRGAEWLERQKAQQGLYILFHNDIVEIEECTGLFFCRMISPIEKDSKYVKERIIIKKNCKSKILKQLSYLGISEDRLFPDNIDIICSNIARYFSNHT